MGSGTDRSRATVIDPGSERTRAGLRLTVVIPVYNEGANFPALWQSLTTSIKSPFTAVVVYDFDEDDTLPVVRKLTAGGESRVKLVKNAFGRGVVGAIRTGFDTAERGPVLVVMADLSDDLNKVDEMVKLYEAGFDIVVGSRYMPGGGIQGGPLLKKTLSRLAGISLFYLRRIPTHDATNAFKIYDAEMLRGLTIESQGGFELNLELTVKGFLRGHAIAEVPSVWKDRAAGESRFRLWKWLPSYLYWYFKAFQRRRSPRIA